MADSLHQMSANELLRGYHARSFSPVEATEAAFAQIDAHNEQVNAFCRLDREGALVAARESESRWSKGEPRGLLDGVPVSIKDLVLTKGMATLLGSRTVNPEQPWDVDAPATARLREHGAVILGKTCTPEFGHKFVTDSPLTGITRNPWNLERSSGGSSGGAGGASALGMGPLAVGTDGGGSIRIPSAWCGIVGHKPTFGRVPNHPPPRWGSLSNVGPMANSVEDAALMLTVLAGPDPRDWHALPAEKRDYRVGLSDGVAGLRLAYSPDMGLCSVDPQIAQKVSDAVQVLAGLGAQVDEIAPPGIEAINQAHVTCKAAIFAQQLSSLSPGQWEMLDESVREMAEQGKGLSAMDFQEALLARADAGTRIQALYQQYDLLITPTFHMQQPPVPGLPAEMRGKAAYLTSWVNHTMQPAATVPCGMTEDKLPVGLQIIGPKYADALVLRAARAYESARGPFPRPDLERR